MFTQSTQTQGCEPDESSLTQLGIFFFFTKYCGFRLKESWKPMRRQEREQPDSSLKVVRQATVKGMWVSQVRNLSMGNWLCPWEHTIPKSVQFVAWWWTEEFTGIWLSVASLFWLWDWRFPDPELSLSPQPLVSRVSCDGLIVHSDTFPLPADDTRERLLHPGSDSARLRKHIGQPANCSSAGQNTHSPCSPAVQTLTPKRQVTLSGSGCHRICRSIHEVRCAGRSVSLCLHAHVGWQVQGPWSCRSLLAVRVRAACGPLVCVPHAGAQVPLNKMRGKLNGTKRTSLPATDGPG